MRRRLALRFCLRVDGRCSALSSDAFSLKMLGRRAPHPPTGSGSRHDRRLRIQPGVCPRGPTARTRVRPVAARCPRAEWTVSCDLPSIVRNDDRTATLVWFEHHAPAVARCSILWRYPAFAGGGCLMPTSAAHLGRRSQPSPGTLRGITVRAPSRQRSESAITPGQPFRARLR